MIVCKHSDLEWGGNETGKKHVKQFVVILLGFPIMNLIQSNNLIYYQYILWYTY